jgi:rhodanese-related sulfurtransferase
MAASDVTPDQLRQRLSGGEDLYLLDVREPDEVLGGRTAELPTDRPIVVLCHSGVRSAAAADALERSGWAAANLAGGAVAWVASES